MDSLKQESSLAEFNLPEWETTARYRGEKATKDRRNVKERGLEYFERVMPAHRRYCGLSRNVACIAVLATLVLVIALILGLAIGLSKKSNHRQSLPLGSKTYTGDLTYYGPGLGACGITSSNNDNIVSISHIVFDAVSTSSNPNANPLCGHKLRAVRDGNSMDLTVVDRCVGCEATDIDVSPGAFEQLADPTLGRVEVIWAWLPPVPAT